MNTEKIALIEKLIKDGAISLAEGLVLLETEKEYVYYPMTVPNWQPTPIYYDTTIPYAPYKWPVTSGYITTDLLSYGTFKTGN